MPAGALAHQKAERHPDGERRRGQRALPASAPSARPKASARRGSTERSRVLAERKERHDQGQRRATRTVASR